MLGDDLEHRAQAVEPVASGRPRSSRTQSTSPGSMSRRLGEAVGAHQLDVGPGVEQQLADQEGVALVVLDEQHAHG